MITEDKINIFIQEGEGLTVEFKERFSPRIDEGIVAFANTKGGVILLGVRDDRTVTGEKLTNDLKARINSVARNCSPSIHVKIRQLQNIICIEVPQGDEKPYSCASGYFRRLDGTTQKMSRNELRLMFLENEQSPFEEKINRDITWKDISRQKIQAFLKESHVSMKKAAPEDILASLGVARNGKITNAGILFFAKNIRQFIFHAQMTLIAFKGTDRVHIYDRQDIEDDLLTQFNAAELFLKKHLNRRSEIIGMNRRDIYELPLEALREALTNALIHRDYSIRGTSLMVEIFDDRVDMVNPGGLLKGFKTENFGRVSVRRNERVADLFFRMDKGERAGTGIRRMNEAMEEADLPKPDIQYDDMFFFISFKRRSANIRQAPSSEKGFGEKLGDRLGEKLGKNEKRILDILIENRFATIPKLAEALKISSTAVEKNLGKLKQRGILKRIGSAKGGHWEIINVE
jgi:ATP-dependent DNA helicase RecG